ncbi:hypothetical protein [Veronia pacifica]|uniref:Uncharacterized protein n=1 Tax=Veronia pacifica TaxID=1080227 RepID=A0A1C3ECR3_9GAMM|nr:hypothetical protein [Veronia pacifica]ODA31000.1 hypothetical protein A8L45_18360 [Veronia pacifica]
MKKYFAIGFLIASSGCGGGGGDGTAVENTPVPSSSTTAYGDDKLDIYVSFESMDGNKAKASSIPRAAADNTLLTLGEGDAIEVTVDGVNQELSRQENTEVASYSLDTVSDASEYELTFSRESNNTSYSVNFTQDALPVPVSLTHSFAGEVISIDVSQEAGHFYSIPWMALNCSSERESLTAAADSSLDENGSYQQSLKGAFDSTQSELLQRFDKCHVDITVSASKIENAGPYRDGPLKVSVSNIKEIRIDL